MLALTNRILAALRFAAISLGLLACGVAQASVSPPPTVWPPGDALAGKSIYPGACLTCHTGTSNATDRFGKVGNGANNPGLINRAILNGTMTNSVLRALTAQQIADIAAYLGNPNVSANAPIASATPTSLAFAATALGATSSTKTVTLANTGNASLGPISFSVSGPFAMLPGTCKAGGSVAAGASCTVTVSFKPIAVGAATGKLTFVHNATPATTEVALSGTGVAAAAPVAVLNPTSLAFASTVVGSTSSAKSVTLSNSGNAALLVKSFVSSSPAVFVVSGGTCVAGGSVAAGASCTVSLNFKPAVAGSASGTLTFSHNASPATSKLGLSGTGVAAAPVASVTPTALTYSQVVGSTSADQVVTVANTGKAPLVLSAASIGGAQASEFAKAPTSTCGASVAVGASCTLRINFTPAAVGARNGTLSIAHNAPGSPAVVALNGTGTASPQPVVSVNMNALSFSALPVGSSATQSLIVTNSGHATLVLASLKLTGAHSTDYALGGSCVAGMNIAVAQTCTITVRFTAGVTGTRNASLDIASNAPTVKVGLTGVAVPVPAPAVTLTPVAVDFGTATVGGAAQKRSISLTNSGSATLVLNGSAVSGNGFSSTDTCGASLAAGASCSFSIAFAPAGVGSFTGALTVNSNASGSPHKVALSGTGALAPLAVLAWTPTAPQPVFADTGVGATSAPVTLTLVNQGPGSATLDAIGTGSGEFGVGGTCRVGASLASQATCTVTLEFAPAQVGPRIATLVVSSTGTDPAPVALDGLGVLPGQAKLTMSPTSLKLPSGDSGEPPTPAKAVLKNTGTTDISITALRVKAGRFTVTQTCGRLPLLLAPGQACELVVALAADAPVGDALDVLVVTTDVDSVAPTLKIEAEVPELPAAVAAATQIPGSGGCSLVDPHAGLFDPTLWLLCALAGAVLWSRRARHDALAAAEEVPSKTHLEIDR
jgi:hypothetical protein